MFRILHRRRAATWIDYGLLTAGVLFLFVVTITIVDTHTNLFPQHTPDSTSKKTPILPSTASLSWNGPTIGYDITRGISPGPFQSVFLTNDGPSNAPTANLAIVGPDAARFSIVLNTCTGPLAPAASCEVRIALVSNTNGNFSAALSVPGAENHPLFGTASGF